MIKLLRGLPQITLLVSTHDMRLVQELFPRTIVMDEGQVVADSLTMEILENEELSLRMGWRSHDETKKPLQVTNITCNGRAERNTMI